MRSIGIKLNHYLTHTQHHSDLGNRKHVPSFYQVIETWVEVWENEQCCGNKSCRRVFPQLFRHFPDFHKCFSNPIETQRTCYLFLLENIATNKREKTCLVWSSKCKFSLLAPSLRSNIWSFIHSHEFESLTPTWVKEHTRLTKVEPTTLCQYHTTFAFTMEAN